jgi:hypothetical protein
VTERRMAVLFTEHSMDVVFATPTACWCWRADA